MPQPLADSHQSVFKYEPNPASFCPFLDSMTNIVQNLTIKRKWFMMTLWIVKSKIAIVYITQHNFEIELEMRLWGMGCTTYFMVVLQSTDGGVGVDVPWRPQQQPRRRRWWWWQWVTLVATTVVAAARSLSCSDIITRQWWITSENNTKTKFTFSSMDWHWYGCRKNYVAWNR